MFDNKIVIILCVIIYIILLVCILYFYNNYRYSEYLRHNEQYTSLYGDSWTDYDAIREYDYNKIFDPLENPAKRIPRHEIPPYYFKRMIDIPTRGYPDNFTQFGTLILKNKNDKMNQNAILKLFGRQEYPGSNTYEYYTMVNSGMDQIKIPIYGRRRELYSGDMIFIKELESKYEVNLYKYDQPKYYPDIL